MTELKKERCRTNMFDIFSTNYPEKVLLLPPFQVFSLYLIYSFTVPLSKAGWSYHHYLNYHPYLDYHPLFYG